MKRKMKMVKSSKVQRNADVARVAAGLKFTPMRTNIDTIVYIKESMNVIFNDFGYSRIL